MTAYLRQAKFGRLGPEKVEEVRKWIIEEGNIEPLTFTTTVPGTILTSCQSYFTLEGRNLRLTAPVLVHHGTHLPQWESILSGHVLLVSIVDDGTVLEEKVDPRGCPHSSSIFDAFSVEKMTLQNWKETTPGVDGRWLSWQLRLRHPVFNEVTLLNVTSANWSRGSNPRNELPLSVYAVVHVPLVPQLQELFQAAVVELTVRYIMNSAEVDVILLDEPFFPPKEVILKRKQG